MEQQPNPAENQEFSQVDLNAVVNQRNEQAMQEQADLARNAQENQAAAERTEEARRAVERATNPDLIQEVPKAEPAPDQAQSSEPLITGIPENLQNKE